MIVTFNAQKCFECSLTLDCLRDHFVFNSTLNGEGGSNQVNVVSEWHCQKLCQANDDCAVFSWNYGKSYVCNCRLQIYSYFIDGVCSLMPGENDTLVSDPFWFSGVADCKFAEDFLGGQIFR